MNSNAPIEWREVRLTFPEFRAGRELWSDALMPQVTKQLAEQGCCQPDDRRYHVFMEVVEGRARPAKDVDNYYKPIIDTVTKTQLAWRDDCQVDHVTVRRTISAGQAVTTVTITITAVPAGR